MEVAHVKYVSIGVRRTITARIRSHLCRCPTVVISNRGDGGGGNYSGGFGDGINLALVITAVSINPVFIITPLAIGGLGIAVPAYGDLAVLGTAVFVTVVAVVTFLVGIFSAVPAIVVG